MIISEITMIITIITATIGALLGIFNFLIWWSQRNPQIKVEVVRVTSDIYDDEFFIKFNLLVHNKSEKLTSVYRIDFESDYFFDKKGIREYDAPQFISAHSSRRFIEEFQCKKEPDEETKIKITAYHTHGVCVDYVEYIKKKND